MFDKFRELRTREEQAASMELAEHANTVMTTLDEGIKGLDNLDAFFEFLHQVGASHRRIPGFKVEYFWVNITKINHFPVPGLVFFILVVKTCIFIANYSKFYFNFISLSVP